MKISQFIFAITNALDEMAANSAKIYFIDYYGHTNNLYVSIRANREAYQTKLYERQFYLQEFSPEDFEKKLAATLREISEIAALPDAPVEKMVTVQLPLSKAKEMGVA
jgi:hypothetical protein